IDTPLSQLYTLSLHDALPISVAGAEQTAGAHRPASGGADEVDPHELFGRRQLLCPVRAITGSEDRMRSDSPSELGADHLDRRERSEEHTSELQSRFDLVCRLL